MLKKINLSDITGARELSIITAKLANMEEISVIPIKVINNMLIIGFDSNEYLNDWEFIGRKINCRVYDA